MIRLPALFFAALALMLAGAAAAQPLPTPLATRIDSGRGDVATALAADAAGNAYVGGTVDDRQRATQFAVAKIDAQGRIVWRSHDNGAIGGPAGRVAGVAVDRQGQVVATGTLISTVGNSTQFHSVLSAFDASGAPLWSREVGGAKVAVDAADRIVVSSRGGQTAQFSSSGAMLWSRSADGISIIDMRLDAGGSVFITGVGPGRTTLGARSIVALKYDPQGNLVWRSTYTTTDVSDDAAFAIAPALDGGAFVVGTTSETGPSEAPIFPILLKFDGLGLVHVVGVGAQYGGTDVAVGATGDVTVLGEGVVSRLDANGTIRWTRAVSGASQVMALAASGDVFVSAALATTRISAAGEVDPALVFTDPGRPRAQTAALHITAGGTLLAAGFTAANALSTSPDIVVLRYAGGGAPPAAQPPAAPSNLSATARRGIVTLAWRDNADNETGFRIERCEQSGCGDFAAIGSSAANASSFADTAVVRGVTYRYRVRALNAVGASAPSNTDNVRAR